ncbi:MAG TPA: hypothetical protein DDY31_19300 [Lachnospiraceae bacterium]|nr:hypothetical protein [Lachnospiraceae bacterium]
MISHKQGATVSSVQCQHEKNKDELRIIHFPNIKLLFDELFDVGQPLRFPGAARLACIPLKVYLQRRGREIYHVIEICGRDTLDQLCYIRKDSRTLFERLAVAQNSGQTPPVNTQSA